MTEPQIGRPPVDVANDDVTQASNGIAAQVLSAQEATGTAAAAMQQISAVIEQMDQQFSAVATAAGGGLVGQAGLSHMAEALRLETEQFIRG